MNNNINNTVRIQQNTVKVISKFITGFLTDQSIVSVSEGQYIISELKHISKHNERMPKVFPKLLTMQEVTDILSIGLSNFKKLEKENFIAKENETDDFDPMFPKRRYVGKAIRYRNLDVYRYAMATEE